MARHIIANHYPSNKPERIGKYMKDQLEDQKWSESMGQVQVYEGKKKSDIKKKIIKKLK